MIGTAPVRRQRHRRSMTWTLQRQTARFAVVYCAWLLLAAAASRTTTATVRIGAAGAAVYAAAFQSAADCAVGRGGAAPSSYAAGAAAFAPPAIHGHRRRSTAAAAATTTISRWDVSDKNSESERGEQTPGDDKVENGDAPRFVRLRRLGRRRDAETAPPYNREARRHRRNRRNRRRDRRQKEDGSATDVVVLDDGPASWGDDGETNGGSRGPLRRFRRPLRTLRLRRRNGNRTDGGGAAAEEDEAGLAGDGTPGNLMGSSGKDETFSVPDGGVAVVPSGADQDLPTTNKGRGRRGRDRARSEEEESVARTVVEEKRREDELPLIGIDRSESQPFLGNGKEEETKDGDDATNIGTDPRASEDTSTSPAWTSDEGTDVDSMDSSENGVKEKGGKGRRVTFSAAKEATRTFSFALDAPHRSAARLREYMTQPVEQYSVISFHDDGGGGRSNGGGGSSSSSTAVMRRRWLVRRLTDEESRQYASDRTTMTGEVRQQQARPERGRFGAGILRRRASTAAAQMRDGIASEASERRSDGDSDDDGATGGNNNFFRLAVPLLPLVGLDLTPVIDLEVIPPDLRTSMTNSSSVDSASSSLVDGSDGAISWRDGDDSRDAVDKSNNGRRWRGGRILRRGQERNDNQETIRIQSLRVSLLSTEDEVRAVMEQQFPTARRKGGRRRGGGDKGGGGGGQQVQEFSPTAISQNESIRRMGPEAIGAAAKIEEWLRPHLSFEAEITWSDEGNDSAVLRNEGRRTVEKSSVRVKSMAVTSLTIPELPFALPLPSSFLVKKLGSTLTTKALEISLPRFLRQLERDFDRWASVNFDAAPTVDAHKQSDPSNTP